MDAVYKKKKETDDIAEDYAQIYNDFNIVSHKQIAKSIIIINSVDIDSPNVLKNHVFEKMMFQKGIGKVTTGFPYTMSCHSNILDEVENKEVKIKAKSILDMPLTVLFPNLLSDKGEDISMISIFKVVISIAFLSLKEDSKVRGNYDKRLTSEGSQREFCGFDLTNLYQSQYSRDNFFKMSERKASSGIISDNESKIQNQKFKSSDSFNHSFDVSNSGKMNSSDDENSGPDSCSSLQTLGNAKTQNSDPPQQKIGGISSSQNLRMKNKSISLKNINEGHLPKVNWKIGFEEASSRNIFDCLWMNTDKVSEQVVKKLSQLVYRYSEKLKRDNKIKQLHPEVEVTSEAYFKKKNIQISTMVS